MAYTQRWFGTGEWPADKPYSRDVHSDDLVAVLQAIGEPVHLVGLSNGGPPALWAAIRAPELVRSLVLYEANLPDVLFGSDEGEEALGAFFGGFGDVEAALEAGDNDEAARELIEAIYALPEGGFASIDPVQQAMVLDNAAHDAAAVQPARPDAAGLRRARGDRGADAGDRRCRDAEDVEPGGRCDRRLHPRRDARRRSTAWGTTGRSQAKDAFVKLTLDFVDAH